MEVVVVMMSDYTNGVICNVSVVLKNITHVFLADKTFPFCSEWSFCHDIKNDKFFFSYAKNSQKLLLPNSTYEAFEHQEAL